MNGVMDGDKPIFQAILWYEADDEDHACELIIQAIHDVLCQGSGSAPHHKCGRDVLLLGPVEFTEEDVDRLEEEMSEDPDSYSYQATAD